LKLIVAEMETITGDFADLRSLCAVIEQGGITAAARLLGESKGSVSRRITRLEEQLGVKLLNRSSRAVSATAEGRVFYHRSIQALALLDEGATELRNTNLEPSGLLRVTMPVDLGLSIFPPLIAEFLDLYPKIRVEVLLNETVLDLTTNQIDVAFRVGNMLPDSTYIPHRLTDISIQLFASPQYLDRHPIPDTPRDLAHHSIFLHPKLFGAKPLIFDRGDRSHQVTLSANGMANDFFYLKQMAILGAGIALIPDFLGQADCQTGQLVRILPEWSIGPPKTLYLLHEGWRLLPAKVRCFKDFIGDRFKTFDRD
jgi:DNA-binding transcriptional LysR family regulator